MYDLNLDLKGRHLRVVAQAQMQVTDPRDKFVASFSCNNSTRVQPMQPGKDLEGSHCTSLDGFPDCPARTDFQISRFDFWHFSSVGAGTTSLTSRSRSIGQEATFHCTAPLLCTLSHFTSVLHSTLPQEHFHTIHCIGIGYWVHGY